MAIAFVKIEVARDFSRGEVDHFDSHLRSENEQLLLVLSEHDLQRGVGFELDLIDHLLLRFIDDENLVGPGTEVHQRAGGFAGLSCVGRRDNKKQDNYEKKFDSHSGPPLGAQASPPACLALRE